MITDGSSDNQEIMVQDEAPTTADPGSAQEAKYLQSQVCTVVPQDFSDGPVQVVATGEDGTNASDVQVVHQVVKVEDAEQVAMEIDSEKVNIKREVVTTAEPGKHFKICPGWNVL